MPRTQSRLLVVFLGLLAWAAAYWAANKYDSAPNAEFERSWEARRRSDDTPIPSNGPTPTSTGSGGASTTAAAAVRTPLLEMNNAPLPSVTEPFFSIPGTGLLSRPTKPAWGAFWSYPQAPIPVTTVSSDAAAFTVAGSQPSSLAQGRQTREYTFNLAYAAGYPDGFLRRMAVINNVFPGPLIEANEGDDIVVHVHNNLDHPQSIHWHGMRQNGTNAMDGVPGFSQCPIPPGGSFTYRFKADGVGTFWYHSHYGNTMSDGLIGALLLHSAHDVLKIGQDFDDDRVVYLSDWMNDQSEVIVKEEEDLTKPYRGIPFVAEPDSVLINGVGQVNCDRAVRGVPCARNMPPAEIKAQQGKQVRLRLINMGGQGMIRLSVDKHKLRVIEADDTAVEDVWVSEIPVGTGERYSVVIKLDQGEEGDSFWIRAHVATYCINQAALVNGVGILRYTDETGGNCGTDDPTSEPWDDLADPKRTICKDLDEYYPLIPRIPEDAPETADEAGVMDALFGVFVHPIEKTKMIGFGMNSIMYTNYINNPLLNRVMDGAKIGGAEIAAITFDGTGAADLILNVLDPPPIGHPFHLHGRPFYIIARGAGYVNLNTLPLVHKNLKNPLRRDTFVISEQAYAVIRIKLDDPGVWPLHCHIGWHLAAGKMAAVIIGTDSVKNQSKPEEWLALCEGTDKNEIGPGRREYVPPRDGGVLFTMSRKPLGSRWWNFICLGLGVTLGGRGLFSWWWHELCHHPCGGSGSVPVNG